jgi:hypothetical protein
VQARCASTSTVHLMSRACRAAGLSGHNRNCRRRLRILSRAAHARSQFQLTDLYELSEVVDDNSSDWHLQHVQGSEVVACCSEVYGIPGAWNIGEFDDGV